MDVDDTHRLVQEVRDLNWTIDGMRHELVEARSEIERHHKTITRLRDHLRAVLDEPLDTQASRFARRYLNREVG